MRMYSWFYSRFRYYWVTTRQDRHEARRLLRQFEGEHIAQRTSLDETMLPLTNSSRNIGRGKDGNR